MTNFPRFFLVCFIFLSQILAYSNATKQTTPMNVEFVQFFNEEVNRLILLERKAKEECRMKICMNQFKSVGICKGVGSFYLWAKVVAANMARNC